MHEHAPVHTGWYHDERKWHIAFGPGSVEQLPEVMDAKGWRRAVLVVPRSLESAEPTARLRALLGNRIAGHVVSRQHTPLSTVAQGAALMRELRADSLISFGGGSAVDMAKGMALATAAGDLAPFKGRPARRGDGLVLETDAGREAATAPIVAIPTTLSGAEFTYQAGLTDDRTGRKDQYYARSLLPSVLILDPTMTLLTPERLWLSSGIKSLDHAVERWYSRRAQPFSDALSARAITITFSLLPVSAEHPGDLGARTDLLIAAWMSQFATGNTPVGIGHAIDHQLCAIYDIPHGIAPCIMLPAAMEFNRSHAGPKLSEMARLIGQPEATPEAAIEGVRALVRRLGLPGRLRELGIGKEHFDAIAERTLTDTAIIGNPRPVEDAATVREILERAW